MMQNHSVAWQRAVLIFCVSQSLVMGCSYANEGASSTLLAMGDIGTIKSELTPSDPAANLAWIQLTDQQRSVLSPLASEWDSLRPWQREKMLDIAKEYPKMDAQKQQRIQHRLVKWSRMTPYERENARKRYQQFQSLSPEKKEALRKQWQEHQRKAAASEGYDPEFDGVDP